MEQILFAKKGVQTLRFFVGVVAAIFILMYVFPETGLAYTPAGTVIGNQATATYEDSANNKFTAQSNLFSVTVTQIAGLALTPSSQGRSSAPGNQVQFPHMIKNTGNATDTFNMATSTSGTVTLTSIDIIRDDNVDGIANPGEPVITSLSLAMDQSKQVVVRGTIPTSATNNQTGSITLTVTSATNAAITASSTDTATVVTKAVIALAKSVSALSVNPEGFLDYTINYNNAGVASTAAVGVTLNGSAASRHVVRDVLPTSTGFDSFLGTPTPAGGEQVYHITGTGEDVYQTAAPADLTTVDAVAYLFSPVLSGGQSGVFSFRVKVATSTQVGIVSNTAVMKFHDGTATTSQTSNTTETSVNLIAKVVIKDDDGGTTDVQDVASGNAGSTIPFNNVVQNTANGADKFNITVANGNFPSGTTFALFAADGVTPLLDTNADGIPDTGLMNAATSTTIIMKATLPANATNTGSPFIATTTAKSVADPSKTDTVTNRLTTIVLAGVDLTNTAALGGAGVTGTGAGPEASPMLTLTGDPGVAVDFVLYVNNTGPNPDSFELEFSNTASFTTPGALPMNASSIQFFAADGSGNLTGAPITNSGQVASSTAKKIFARVTSAASTTGSTNIDLFFRVLSAGSGAKDHIMDRLTVNIVRGISLQQNQTGQTSPGSATTYSHILKNIGNVTEPQINLTAINSQNGFLTTIYLDNNGDGLINGADAVITAVTSLLAGTSTNLIIRVAAPSSAPNGTVDTMTLTATPTGTVGTVGAPPLKTNTDQTTAVTGQIALSLAASPTGNQPPGQTITYTITYQNVGAAAVMLLVITDAIPVNTTYVANSMQWDSDGPAGATAAVSLTDAVDSPTPDAGKLIGGNKGSVQFSIGTVASGVTGTVSFQVKID